MPYIYPQVDSLLKQPFIKEGDRVDLIKGRNSQTADIAMPATMPSRTT